MEKIAALAMTAVLCAGVIRRGTPELSLLLILGAGLGICSLTVGALEQVIMTIRELSGLSNIGDGALRPVIKTVAVSVTARITSDLCRGAGEGGMAAFVEAAGAVFSLSFALPLAKEVLELMAQLLT